MKRTLAVVALLTLTGVGAGVAYQAAARDRSYRGHIASGDAALADDQIFAAIEAYSGAIALRPDSMLAHLRLAETYQRRSNLEEAAREFRRATNLDQTAIRPFEELGDVLYQLGRFDRAVDAYGRAVRLDDRSARLTYKLALAEYRNGAVAAALKTATASLAVDPRSAESQYLLGLCFRDARRTNDALQAFVQAATLAPAMMPAHEELADLYHELGRTVDELDQLRTLAALDRGNVDRQIALALAHQRLGHGDLAVLTLGEALERSPGNPAIYGALGQVWLERSRDDRALIRKAREALERAAVRPDASSHTLSAYAHALLEDGEVDEAARVLQLAATRFPVDADAFLQYATILEHQNRSDPARRALAEYAALVGEPHDPRYLALVRRLR